MISVPFDINELFKELPEPFASLLKPSALTALQNLRYKVEELVKKVKNDPDYVEVRPGIVIHKSALVAPSALIEPPAVIMADTEIRHCAYLRSCVVVGRGCVIGNSCEIKNSLIMDSAEIPHFNYVGDSVIGVGAHLGGGAIISNLKQDKRQVPIRIGGCTVDTGMRKLGALVGDRAEIGAGAVLNPGSVIGAEARVYPLCSVRGFVPSKHIYKGSNIILPIE